DDPNDTAVTAPFMAFNSGSIDPGTTVAAATPATPQEGIIAGNGTVYSFDPTAADASSTLRLEAWGFRNPFGIGIDPADPTKLFVSNNGADTRGVAGETSTPTEDFEVIEARPIEEDYDDLFVLDIGGSPEFFGWPDYFHDEESGDVEPVTAPIFCGEEGEKLMHCPDFVLDESFRNGLTVSPAFAELGYHTSANKFDFSPGTTFGFDGDLFVAYTGSFVPITGAVQFVGYKVVRVERDTGEVDDFIANTGDTAEEVFDPESFNKPIDVEFRDDAMLVVDFGVFEPGLKIMQPGTGKVWIVTPSE
ncbi:MAG TPA: hypothetical protein VF171_00285, partial [Trueperaceae bacterium]